jgi:hypothetical protein
MSELTKIYNPANAAALTPEQVDAMQQLTSPQILELAKAYPNMTMQRAYLLIIDSKSKAKNQLPTLSTFENLYNLREKNGQRGFVAYGFKGAYKTKATQLRPKRSDVLDLSETELMTLPGFKTADSVHPAQTVEVVKVKRVAMPTEPEVINATQLAKRKPGRPAKTQIQ